MPKSEMKNAPPLYGWAIATAAGVVAAAVSFVLIGIEGNGSVAIGVVIALIVGTIFTIAEKPKSTASASSPSAKTDSAVSASGKASVSAPAASASTSAKGSVKSESRTEASAPAEQPAKDEVSASSSEDTGTKPAALSAPVGAADDLKQISGVGPVLEGKLNDLGIYHFWQIAGWSEDEITWVDGFLNFRGRITRDDWIAQASKLAKDSPSKPPA